jgi:UDP-glucose 4-epimerase
VNKLSKIIVTGGAGFIGGHLVSELVSREHEVLVVDNLYSGRREHVPGGVGFLNLDLALADETTVFEVIRGFRPDAIIHLAAIHYIPHCLANPADTFLANVRSTDVIARALRGLPTRRLIAASTADVYPLLDQLHNESETPAPTNPYGLSKFLLEEIIAGAARTNRALSCVALRIFNVYGPRDTNPHVIPRIIELLHGPSPEIRMGAIETTRDFIHVEDVVKAIYAALTHQSEKYEVFNVGTGRATSIRHVLNILLGATGDKRPVIQDKDLFRAYDRASLTSDITKITQALDWRPTVALEEGLARLVQQTFAVPPPAFPARPLMEF